MVVSQSSCLPTVSLQEDFTPIPAASQAGSSMMPPVQTSFSSSGAWGKLKMHQLSPGKTNIARPSSLYTGQGQGRRVGSCWLATLGGCLSVCLPPWGQASPRKASPAELHGGSRPWPAPVLTQVQHTACSNSHLGGAGSHLGRVPGSSQLFRWIHSPASMSRGPTETQR